MKINCINSFFSAHLYYVWTAATSPGYGLEMKYGHSSEKVKRHRQVILTRQTILHSGFTCSGTDWEPASTGVSKWNLEKFDSGHSVKKAPKESGSYSLCSHTSIRISTPDGREQCGSFNYCL